MNGVNKVILVGRLGQDPKLRHFENGGSVADFSLATSDVYKDKDGNKVEQTEWHNVVLRSTLAPIAEKYLHKGDLVYIEGKLRTRNWDDKDGHKRYITEVIGLSMTMLGAKSSSNGAKSNTATAPVTVSETTTVEETPESLPF